MADERVSADPGGSTSADGSSHLAPAAGAEIAARAVLLLVVLVALVDCWCRSAIGCRPAVAGGTIVRPAAVCVAFGCALVCCVLGVVDALAPSEALAQAKAVSLLVAAGACWPVALVVLRTSAWRAESARTPCSNIPRREGDGHSQNSTVLGRSLACVTYASPR